MKQSVNTTLDACLELQTTMTHANGDREFNIYEARLYDQLTKTTRLWLKILERQMHDKALDDYGEEDFGD